MENKKELSFLLHSSLACNAIAPRTNALCHGLARCLSRYKQQTRDLWRTREGSCCALQPANNDGITIQLSVVGRLSFWLAVNNTEMQYCTVYSRSVDCKYRKARQWPHFISNSPLGFLRMPSPRKMGLRKFYYQAFLLSRSRHLRRRSPQSSLFLLRPKPKVIGISCFGFTKPDSRRRINPPTIGLGQGPHMSEQDSNSA